MIHLGVNIDHVATLRQSRRGSEPDPVWAAAVCELAGASNITVHLREDRRHIQDRDVEILKKTIRSKMNLEMANVSAIINFAIRIQPDQVTLVPEKREELTTEGGLDVVLNRSSLKKNIKILKNAGIITGFFIDASADQVEASRELEAGFVEFHTGRFAHTRDETHRRRELEKLFHAAEMSHQMGLGVHAGHGLHYLNIHRIREMPYLREVNIGHAIVSRAVFVGLENAVREMVSLLYG